MEKATGYILISENFYPTDTPYILHAKGIISLFGSILSHVALVAREFDIPAIVGVYDFSVEEDINRVVDLLKSGKKLGATMYGNGRIVVETEPENAGAGFEPHQNEL